ncbi:hypothetical protein SESBI_01551 [Sesbania bispinosa]|nr:hypothetical protein SESBI_01551 [Sesbania bispinosa]
MMICLCGLGVIHLVDPLFFFWPACGSSGAEEILRSLVESVEISTQLFRESLIICWIGSFLQATILLILLAFGKGKWGKGNHRGGGGCPHAWPRETRLWPLVVQRRAAEVWSGGEGGSDGVSQWRATLSRSTVTEGRSCEGAQLRTKVADGDSVLCDGGRGGGGWLMATRDNAVRGTTAGGARRLAA